MCVGGGKTDAGVAPASGVANGVGWAKGAAAEPPDAGVATANGVANGVGWEGENNRCRGCHGQWRSERGGLG